ncbi:MAG: DUF2147 domain-containing protein [Bacteroidota bacterium]
MMKKIIFVTIFVFASFWVQAQSDIVGTWLNEDKSAKVEVVEVEDGVEGKLVWVKNEKAKDKLGTVIFKDLKAKGDKWKGEVFALKRGEHYDTTYTVIEEGKKLELNVSVGLFSQSQVWTRVEE